MYYVHTVLADPRCLMVASILVNKPMGNVLVGTFTRGDTIQWVTVGTYLVSACKCTLCTIDNNFPAKSGVPAIIPQLIHDTKVSEPQLKCAMTVLINND